MQLELVNISKSYGNKSVLKNVSFTVHSGRATGFLGRNGAGKTTTIRSLMDVFKPSGGSFLIDGKPFVRDEWRVGYMPEERGMYAKIGILEQLSYFGELKDMSRKAAKNSAEKWLEFMGLQEYAKKKMEVLSKGNQQKVQLIQAIINDPEILILDEPFSGLDPVNAQVLKDIIREFIHKERIVIFSSHQMSHVEEFCDDIALIKNGEIILSGSLRDIKKTLGKNRLRLRIREMDNEQLTDRLKSLGFQKLDADQESVIVELPNETGSNDLVAKLLDAALPIELFSDYEPSLDDIFILYDQKYSEKQGGIVQ